MYCQNDEERLETNEAYARLKEAFLNGLYHEIRTPLNGLLGFLELISELQSKVDNEQEPLIEADYYQTVRQCSERFLQTINGIIQLAELQAGEKQTIVKDCVKVDEIVKELVIMLRKTHYKNKPEIRVDFSIKDAGLVIKTDKKKLIVILYHLIDEMIRMGRKIKLKIRVNNHQNDEYVHFCIRMKGWRQNSQEKPSLFEPFTTIHLKKSSVDGFGIGLPLAKQLISLIDGGIAFEWEKGRTLLNCWIPTKDMISKSEHEIEIAKSNHNY